MERQEVYKVLDGERDYQVNVKGVTTSEDEGHSLGDFILFMEHHLNRAKQFWSTWQGQKAHHELRKVMGIGIACFEAHGVPERIITKDPDPVAGVLSTLEQLNRYTNNQT